MSTSARAVLACGMLTQQDFLAHIRQHLQTMQSTFECVPGSRVDGLSMIHGRRDGREPRGEAGRSSQRFPRRAYQAFVVPGSC
jgi:hypothetical protein